MTDYKQEIEEALTRIVDAVYVKTIGVGAVPKKNPDIKREFAETTTALTHLINKAKIDELRDMLEADNDPTQCVHCEILSRIKELESRGEE